MEWQPIETVPDHDNILVWARSDNTINGLSYESVDGWSDFAIHIIAYSYKDETAPLGRAFKSTESDGWGESNLTIWPTHWMLNPPAPQASSQ
jgi:hypothetical protein